MLIECAKDSERHGLDAGFDGRLRHRRELRRMIGRQLRPGSVACRGHELVDADIEKHRRHPGIDEFGEILTRRTRRRRPELVTKRCLQHLLGGRDHPGIVRHGLGTLGDLDVGCRRILHRGYGLGRPLDPRQHFGAHFRLEGADGSGHQHFVGVALANMSVTEGHFYTDNGLILVPNLAAMKAL